MSGEINVLGIDETLDYVLKNDSSVARFGDGEIDIISGRSIPYQDYDVELVSELRSILESQSDERLVVCMPDVFTGLDRYNKFARDFWKVHLERYKEIYENINWMKWYGSTFISRPYIDLEDKSHSERHFEHLKRLWNHRDILIVEGDTSKSGVGNDLFDNANSIARIICPSKNAYFFLEEIETAIRMYGDNKLVLVMLGPAAKLIAYHLSSENRQIIDIGHIDSEYEWFKMGAKTKVKIPYKHTAEFNYSDDHLDIEDPDYRSQIVYTVNNFPKISVIMYFDGDTSQIDSVLLSVVEQSYTNIEIVVIINDASYETMKICEQMSLQDNRLDFTYVDIDDPARGYNIALDTIRGKLITFVNQNDRIDKRYIEKLYRQMHKYNSDVVVSDYVEYDDAKQQYKFHTNGKKKETTYSVIEWFEKKSQLRSISEYWFESLFGRLFKIQKNDKLWFQIGNTLRNNSVVYRMYLSGNKITFVNEPLYVIDRKALLEEHDEPVALDTMEEIITMLKIANIDTIEEEKKYSKSLLFYMDDALKRGNIWRYKYLKSKLGVIESIQQQQEKALE